jgi:hypothetical protein
MVSFLFWNLMGNQAATWDTRTAALRTHLARIATNFAVDVVLLAESGFTPKEKEARLRLSGLPRPRLLLLGEKRREKGRAPGRALTVAAGRYFLSLK